MSNYSSFEEQIEEQVCSHHRLIVDNGIDTRMCVDGVIQCVKMVLLGEDNIPSYWDPKTYEEIFVSDPR